MGRIENNNRARDVFETRDDIGLGGVYSRRPRYNQEETMGTRRRAATWLDLAAGPRWGRKDFDLKLHPVTAGCRECFVLTLAGRLVRAGDGRLTVFRSREAAFRFLMLLEIGEPQMGDHAGYLPIDPDGQQCLRLCGSSLCACRMDDDSDQRRSGARTRYDSRESADSRKAAIS